MARYRGRVSGPLLDRIDLVVRVGRVESLSLGQTGAEDTVTVRERVEWAVRFRSETEPRLSGSARQMIITALDTALVTARGATRLVRLAGTIAALGACETVVEEHVAEALALRGEW
jgi:magnesium chelatase family protein